MRRDKVPPLQCVPVVPCIHLAAYLFSGFILGCSAVSNNRYIELERITEGTGTSVLSAGGKLYFSLGDNWLSMDRGFAFSIRKPFPFWAPTGVVAGIGIQMETTLSNDKVLFLGATLATVKYGSPNQRIQHLCVIPHWWFLILPMTWMCGFYLFKLRRRFRAARSEKQIQA